MAVSIPAGIFNLGAVKLDSQKLANLEGQLLAKKAAKEQALNEALDKYNQDKVNRVTPTGVATNDLEAFNKMKDDIQSYYSKNKDKIAKDSNARYEYDSKWRNLENLVAESKGKVDEAKQPEGLMYSPSFKENGNYEELIKDVHSHNEPLYIQDNQGNLVRNPNRKRFQYSEDLYLPKKLDYGKMFDESAKGFKGDTVLSVVEGSEKLPENKKNFKYDVIKGHGKNAVAGIIDNAFNVISQDRGAMSSLTTEIKKISPKEQAYLWDKYTKNYHPEIAPDDPRSLLIGRMAEQAEKRQYTDKETDERAKAAYGSSLISSRQASGDVGRIDLRNYPIVEGKYNVTDLFQGVKATGLPKGDSWAAKRVLYDPSTNSVTLTEYVSRDSEGNLKGEQTRVVPFETFKQNIKSLNPGADFKYVSGLSNAITGGEGSGATPAPPANAPKMSRAEFVKLSLTKRQEFLNKGGIVK